MSKIAEMPPCATCGHSSMSHGHLDLSTGEAVLSKCLAWPLHEGLCACLNYQEPLERTA